MTVRDWAELVVLLVVTLTSIGRWIEARERVGTAATVDLGSFEARHQEEHVRIWAEVDRWRTRWHDDLVPWQQNIIERLATQEGLARGYDLELIRLRALDRRP